MKYEAMLPGHPKPGDYKLTNISPYKIHQRCAEKFRVGRFLLVADAAHLCNPFGGLGLTGGMVDAGNLADCLIGLAEGIANDDILDKYDEIRRAMWHNIINPVSSDNILRMHSQDPDKALENDVFLKMLVRAEKDPELMEQMKALRENDKMDEANKKEQMNDLMKKQKEQLKSILTEEQMKKFQEGRKGHDGMHGKRPGKKEVI